LSESLKKVDCVRHVRLPLAISLFSLLLPAASAHEPIPTQTIIHAGKLIDVVSGAVHSDKCIYIAGRAFEGWADCPKSRPADSDITYLNWSAYTVIPGLVDLHTHLADTGTSSDVAAPLKASPATTALLGARNARLTLEAGFTTVRDVGTYRGLTDVALRDAINGGIITGPRMFVAGAYITHPGGGGELNGVMPNAKLPPDMRLGVAKGPRQVAARANYLFDQKADFLKLMGTGAVLAIGTEPGAPELNETEMRAAVQIAKSRGSYATAHAHGAAGIKAAIRAGVRSIEHASLIDDEGLQMAKDAGVWLVMDIYNGDYIDRVGRQEKWPEEYLRKNLETTEVQRKAFAKAVKMGVKIGFGTDSGVYPHGQNAEQFAYMVSHGMTPMQAIQSATIDAARLMAKDGEIGSIQQYRYADLVALRGDPAMDIRWLQRPKFVMKEGKIVYQSPD
jgi:imidazolonepropionase-like amidohydrolase